jgi:hypothetical protein
MQMQPDEVDMMEPPQRKTRPILFLAAIIVLGVLARIQLAHFDQAAAIGAIGSYDELRWPIVMVALAVVAAAVTAVVVRGRLSRLSAVGLATVVGGIVLARWNPFLGLAVGFVTAMLLISSRARSLAIAILALTLGTVAGAAALATDHDLSDGPGILACTIGALTLAGAGIALFSKRVGRRPVFNVLHRRRWATRAAWLILVLVGLWLGLSVDMARRFRRLAPNMVLTVSVFDKDSFPLYLRPVAADWCWRGPLGVQDIWAPGAKDLNVIRAWPELEGLTVGPSDTGDDDLKNLSNLSRLSAIRLGDTRVSDDGLYHLGGLTSLFVLDLSGTRLRGEGLRHLAGLNRLAVITLDRTQSSDEHLAHLPPALVRVELRDTKVSGPGLRHLVRLRRLNSLALDGCAITDDALEPFTEMASLVRLGLARTRISDQGLRHLSQMPWLQSLELNETSVSDDGLTHLQPLTKLWYLRLDGTKVTDAGLEALAGMTQLVSLNVRKTAVTSKGVNRLRQAIPLCHVEWDDGR